jgi:dTDP-4-dehydrorhamnose reductase
VVVGRGLNKKEERFLTDSLKYNPGCNAVASDAIAIVVNKNANDTLFTPTSLKSALQGKNANNKTYVFDGLKHEPYIETDQANPQSVYGQSKWEGEEAVRNHKKHIILRTSWVFGSHGQNFLKTILKLAQEKSSLNVVSDQMGTPTSSDLLANVTYNIVKTILKNTNFKDFGTYHVTSSGHTDWYGYACFIIDEAIYLGLKTTMTSKDIKPISSDLYPALAKRPMNSRLDTTKIKKTFMLELFHWEEEVKKVLKEIIH